MPQSLQEALSGYASLYSIVNDDNEKILDCSSFSNLQIRHQERDRNFLAMRNVATTRKTTLEKIMNRCRGSMKKKRMQKGEVLMFLMMRSRLISLMM
jgi:hypothetical protein